MARTKIPRTCQNCGINFISKQTAIKEQRAAKFCGISCYRVWQRTKNPAPNLWARITRTDGCWEWQGYVNESGYGEIRVNGKRERTHRYAWILTYGPIPDGLCVCHKCDNPPCCRPDHLFVGTRHENNSDMKRKGRSLSGDRAWSRRHPERYPRGKDHWSKKHPERVRHGSNHPFAKLNEDIVRTIRARVAAGETQTSVANELGIPRRQIGHIVNRQKWKHVL